MPCGFLTCSLVHDQAPNDSGHMMSKANLLKYIVTCKRLLVPKEPTSPVHAWCTWGNSSPSTICRGRWKPSGFHHYNTPGFLVLSAEPCPGCCEPSSPCLWGGRRKIAQGGDVCFLSSCSQYSWHPQQHITLLFNGVGRMFLQFLPHQKGFILVFLVLWTTCNEE